MPRLFWLKQYVALDSETMQEVHVTTDGQMQMAGEIIKYCRSGRHWVPRNDYLDYCCQGWHEYAKTINLPQGKGREGLSLIKS